MRSWSRRRKILLGATVVVLLWLAVASVVLLRSVRAARDGQEALRRFRAAASVEEVLEPGARARLAEAAEAFERARDGLQNPLLAPLRVVPVASRQLAAAQRLVDGSVVATEVADEALVELQRVADLPVGEGEQRVAVLRDLAALAADAGAGVEGIDLGEPDALIGSLSEAVARGTDLQAEAVQGLARMEGVTQVLADLLEGPGDYLLLGANNAEMRNGGGMFLSAATLSFANGSMRLSEVAPTAEVVLPPGSVPVGAGLQANFGFLDSGRDLRTLGLSPDFPQNAEVAAANWAQVSGTAPRGVIVVDVEAMRLLLRALGAVEVDGVRYEADTVRGELLRNQYRRDLTQDERRDQLGEVAHAVFRRLEAGEWELGPLARELSAAVEGRHLMVWSADPEVQRWWAEVGVDGSVHPNSVGVALVNRAANKLDSWVDTDLSAEVVEQAGRTQLNLTYTVENRAPDETEPYLVGPNIEGLSRGDHRGWVMVTLPVGTTDVEIDGVQVFLDGADAPTRLLAGELTIPAGETATVTVTATLPDDLPSLRFEPSGRIPRTTLTVDGAEQKGDRSHGYRLSNH